MPLFDAVVGGVGQGRRLLHPGAPLVLPSAREGRTVQRRPRPSLGASLRRRLPRRRGGSERTAAGALLRSCEPGRRDALQDRAMSRLSALKMIKRRARKAGLPPRDLRPQLPRHRDRRVPSQRRRPRDRGPDYGARVDPQPSSTTGCPRRSRSTRSSASTSERRRRQVSTGHENGRTL